MFQIWRVSRWQEKDKFHSAMVLLIKKVRLIQLASFGKYLLEWFLTILFFLFILLCCVLIQSYSKCPKEPIWVWTVQLNWLQKCSLKMRPFRHVLFLEYVPGVWEYSARLIKTAFMINTKWRPYSLNVWIKPATEQKQRVPFLSLKTQMFVWCNLFIDPWDQKINL